MAALIDPTTVAFESMTDARHNGLEQNYQFDLVSTDKLLQKYIDRPIAVDQIRGQTTETFNGTLLSTHGGVVGATTAPCRCSRTTPESGCRPCPAA